MDSPEQTWIRVLLFGNLRECTIASESGFVISELGSPVRAVFNRSAALTVRSDGAGLVIGEHTFGPQVEIRPHDPYIFELDGKAFRGCLRLEALPDAGGFQVINAVPMESYLFGVVGAEMYSYWEPEALKAQAVISRTYALYIKNRFARGRNWDVMSTEASQVYRGLTAETPTVRQAVLDTVGQVLIGKHPNGETLLIPTFYSSACGGHTEDVQQVFGERIEALSGVECPHCEAISRPRNFRWGPAAFTMEHISQRLIQRYASLEKLDKIVDFEVARTGHHGRVTLIRLIGAGGKTDTVRGEDFRLSVDPTGRQLKSTIFTVEKQGTNVEFKDGRGFGHGVGLCQCGAQGLARQGHDYRQILEYYYPGSQLVVIETSINP